MEFILVNKEFIDRNDTYNLKEGGSGGWDHLNIPENLQQKIDAGKKGAKKTAEKIKSDSSIKEIFKKNGSENLKKAHAAGRISYDNFKGKNHSEDSREKISKTRKENGVAKGERNSQYGTMWIHNEITHENRKIKKEDPIPNGWLKGGKRTPEQKQKISEGMKRKKD